LNPLSQLPLLALGQAFESRFDLSHRTHGRKITTRPRFAKALFNG
jgi:hypothetical protein